MPVLSEAEFHLWWCVVMIAVEVAWAGLLVWPFVADYRQACRTARRLDDLMEVAAATEEIGPAWERIPRSRP